jgi:hypothetical protein
MPTMLRTLLALGCMLALSAIAPHTVRAGDPVAPAGAAVSSDAGQPAADMPGCPGKANGAPCCTSCQDKLAQGIDPAESAGGCPCQRARKAREAAAAKAREAAGAAVE